MKKKNCELCVKNKAKMYCESDQASLCWDCDCKVHSANFLVAKHSRNLLCHSCQNQTPWSASGPKLSPTLTLCNSCLKNPTAAVQLPDPIEEIEEENYQMETDNEEDDSSENESSENEIDEDNEYDDGNQVVPLSSSSPSSTFSPPSPVRSVSSSGSYGDLSVAGEEEGGVAVAVSSSPWKRVRQSDCLSSEDEENKGKSSSNRVLETNEGATNK